MLPRAAPVAVLAVLVAAPAAGLAAAGAGLGFDLGSDPGLGPAGSGDLAGVPACPYDRARPAGWPWPAAAPEPPGADDHGLGFEGCTGSIRPGAPMSSPAGCTLNFVFRDAAANLYIGTAGHCTAGPGQRVGASGVGLFGTVVYRRFSGVQDFSLVKVDADKHHRVDPTMCTWGGPVGPDPGAGGALPRDVLLEYGWGFATVFTPETRARVLTEFATYPTHVTWNGVGSGGDSGAPVVNQAGHAVAIHTFGQTPFLGAALEGGPSIAAILGMARTAVPTLELVPGDPTDVELLLGRLTYG